jgi:hypothetical protein
MTEPLLNDEDLKSAELFHILYKQTFSRQKKWATEVAQNALRAR